MGRTQGRTTSWDAVADWYGGWMGQTGDRHHRETLIPHLLDLLRLERDETVLDIGCGQGAAAGPVMRRGARYVGVDLSPQMIDAARRRYRRRGRFLVGDATDLIASAGLEASCFDAAFLLMSIQDMEPLPAVLSSAAAILRPGGRLAIVTHHPAFQVPRQSGWGWDGRRKLRFRRVDAYLSAFAAPMPPRPGRGRSQTLRRFHRPISEYVNALVSAGFFIEHLSEVPAHRGNGPPQVARAIERARQEIPLFMGLLARKRMA